MGGGGTRPPSSTAWTGGGGKFSRPRPGTPLGTGHHSRVVCGGVTVGVSRWFPRLLLHDLCAGRPSPRIAPPEARE